MDTLVVAIPDAVLVRGTEGSQVPSAFQSFLLPTLVALATYILVDRLGEWKRRRMHSRLGVVVIDTILEEVRVGLEILRTADGECRTPTGKAPSFSGLPADSWEGMSTISDEVLLRIVELAEGRHYDHFHPRECRTHCKNYFSNIRRNFDSALEAASAMAKGGKDWRGPVHSALPIAAVEGVERMLVTARDLLDANGRRWCPK